MKCRRTPLLAEVEKYEMGKGMEDGFELWTNVVTREWITSDSIIKITNENGTIICSQLLGLDKTNEYNPTPDARTEKYYKKRPCVELVKQCVKIIEDELL